MISHGDTGTPMTTPPATARMTKPVAIDMTSRMTMSLKREGVADLQQQVDGGQRRRSRAPSATAPARPTAISASARTDGGRARHAPGRQRPARLERVLAVALAVADVVHHVGAAGDAAEADERRHARVATSPTTNRCLEKISAANRTVFFDPLRRPQQLPDVAHQHAAARSSRLRRDFTSRLPMSARAASASAGLPDRCCEPSASSAGSARTRALELRPTHAGPAPTALVGRSTCATQHRFPPGGSA